MAKGRQKCVLFHQATKSSGSLAATGMTCLDNPYGIVKRLHPLEEEKLGTLNFFFVEKGGYSMNNQEGISLNF